MRKDSHTELFSDKRFGLISGICGKCGMFQGCYSKDCSSQSRNCLKCNFEIELH